jgi:membrane-bound serine protease (ClpP class)
MPGRGRARAAAARGVLAALGAALAALAAAAPLASADVRVREIATLRVVGTIDAEAARRFEAGIERALARRPAFIVVEVDAEGTEMAPARAMADALRGARGGLEAVALVRGRAAGTALLLALSADHLALAAGARLGDGVARDVPGLADELVSRARERDAPVAVARALVDGSRGLTRLTLEDPSGAHVDAYVAGTGAAAGEGLRVLDRETILEPGAPLVLEGVRARRMGLARFFVRGADELHGELEARVRGPLERRDVDARNAVERFLAWAHAQGLLPVFLFLGLLGLLIELWHPSLIIPGALGLVCFAIALSGGHVAGLTDALDLALIATGVTLIVIEMFVLPGFGFVGIAGLVTLGAGLFLSMQASSWPRTPDQVAEWEAGVQTFALGVVGTIAGFAVASRFLPRSPFLKKLMHSGSQQAADGYTVASASRVALIGRAGTAATDLRPSGKVIVDGETHDAQSEGGWIDRGSPVEVVESHEGRVIVKRRAG